MKAFLPSLLLLMLFNSFLTTNSSVLPKESELTRDSNESIIINTSGSYEETYIHVDNNWTLTEAKSWCYKLGNTYYIENVSIDSGANSGILIENSDEYFVLKNCTVKGSLIGIYLRNANNGTIDGALSTKDGMSFDGTTGGIVTPLNIPNDNGAIFLRYKPKDFTNTQFLVYGLGATINRFYLIQAGTTLQLIRGDLSDVG